MSEVIDSYPEYSSYTEDDKNMLKSAYEVVDKNECYESQGVVKVDIKFVEGRDREDEIARMAGGELVDDEDGVSFFLDSIGVFKSVILVSN